ncbi:hypothetical protein V6C42_00495 [Pseudoclostridium thermosuccinogenes]|nr:hypothetical protein [Pseudoclostridium thermosuccinogenes]
MKKKMKDKDIVKEAVGDPAFYNDKIGENKVPGKTISEKKHGGKCRSGL